MYRRGFSLVSVLVTAAIVAILSVGISKMFVGFAKSGAHVEGNASVHRIGHALGLVVQNDSVCEGAFRAADDQKSVYDNSVEANPVHRVTMGNTAVVENGVSVAPRIKVASIELRPTGAPGDTVLVSGINYERYFASLVVHFDREGSFPVKDLDYKVAIGVHPVSKRIEKCFNGSAPQSDGVQTLLVVHGQHEVPTCPAGWDPLYGAAWRGYSYGGGGATGRRIEDMSLLLGAWGGPEDLGSTGSCMETFRPVPYVEAYSLNPDRGFYLRAPYSQIRENFVVWLYSRTNRAVGPIDTGIAPNIGKISRCVICKKNAPVVVRHSMTNAVPACPTGWHVLWAGYSFGGITQDVTNPVKNFGSTGSCLKHFMPMPFLECGGANNGELCQYGRTNNFAAWLSASNLGNSAQLIGPAAIDNNISRCAVCSL